MNIEKDPKGKHHDRSQEALSFLNTLKTHHLPSILSLNRNDEHIPKSCQGKDFSLKFIHTKNVNVRIGCVFNTNKKQFVGGLWHVVLNKNDINDWNSKKDDGKNPSDKSTKFKNNVLKAIMNGSY